MDASSSAPTPDFWRALLTPNVRREAVAAWCAEYGAKIEWPAHLSGPRVKQGVRDKWLARYLIEHRLDPLSFEVRQSLRVDGQSLARYALDRDVRWALPELLIRGAGPAVEDTGFAFDLLRRQPRRWKTFQVRADLTSVAALRDGDGQTPLHHLAARGNAHGVEGLLRAGADPRATSTTGLTPLHAVWGASDPPPHSGHAATSALLDAAGAAIVVSACGRHAFEQEIACRQDLHEGDVGGARAGNAGFRGRPRFRENIVGPPLRDRMAVEELTRAAAPVG